MSQKFNRKLTVKTKHSYQTKRARKLEMSPVVSNRLFEIDNIELTNHCQFRCIMCPRTNHMDRPLEHMSYPVFKTVIQQYRQTNPESASNKPVYLHHFGESLTNPEFSKCIRYAKSSGVKTCLSINPLLLTDKISDKLLNSCPDNLMIALDGHDNSSFEA